MEQEIITFGLMALKALLTSTDPKMQAVAKALTPQLNEITSALVAAGFGTAA
jgi:hypothetical protein